MKRNNLKIIGVIPARLESTRFPEKPLALINGEEMILWVARAAARAKNLSKLIIATDSEKIRDVAAKAGFACEMTSRFCRSGSDRMCEVALKTEGDIFINIQGDEPLIESELIDSMAAPFLNNPEISVATAVAPLSAAQDYSNPDCVKVVFDKNMFALYFSRSPIPYFRNGKIEMDKIYKHIGIYAFTRQALLDFTNTPKSDYEEAECLEQLRLIENGVRIYCVKTGYISRGVDTASDLEHVIKIINEKKR